MVNKMTKDVEGPKKTGEEKEPSGGGGAGDAAGSPAGGSPAGGAPDATKGAGNKPGAEGIGNDDLNSALTDAYKLYQDAKEAKEDVDKKIEDAKTLKEKTENVVNMVKEIIEILKDPSIDDIPKIMALINDKLSAEEQSEAYNAARRLLS